MKTQIAAKGALTTATNKQVAAEQQVGAAIQSNISAWDGWQQKIESKGRSDADLTNAELARKVQNLKAGIFQSSQGAISRESFENPTGYDPLADIQSYSLQQALANQQERAQVVQYSNAFGQQAAFNKFSDLNEA